MRLPGTLKTSLQIKKWVGFSKFTRKIIGRPSMSSLTAQNELVSIEIDEGSGVAVLAMNRPPANSLSLEMLQSLSRTLREAESNPKVNAAVLSSSNPKIFCAGLDLSELYRPDVTKLASLWSAFQQVHLDLMESRLATFAAIGGHAPAGGCVLALACDYRLFKNSTTVAAKIGLNESALGVTVTPWIGQRYVDTIGHRSAELALSQATLFNAEQALRNGLVDELVPDEDDVVVVAQERALEWMKILPAARMGVKTLMRAPQVEELRHNREADIENFCSSIMEDDVQQTIGSYLEQLSKRK